MCFFAPTWGNDPIWRIFLGSSWNCDVLMVFQLMDGPWRSHFLHCSPKEIRRLVYRTRLWQRHWCSTTTCKKVRLDHEKSMDFKGDVWKRDPPDMETQQNYVEMILVDFSYNIYVGTCSTFHCICHSRHSSIKKNYWCRFMLACLYHFLIFHIIFPYFTFPFF